MPTARTRWTALRDTGTAAVVLSRRTSAPAQGDREAGRDISSGTLSPRRRLWPAVLTWAVLGAAIAFFWVLLLVGDSLR